MSDKLQFVADFGKRLLAGGGDKLKFVGHRSRNFWNNLPSRVRKRYQPLVNANIHERRRGW